MLVSSDFSFVCKAKNLLSLTSKKNSNAFPACDIRRIFMLSRPVSLTSPEIPSHVRHCGNPPSDSMMYVFSSRGRPLEDSSPSCNG